MFLIARPAGASIADWPVPRNQSPLLLRLIYLVEFTAIVEMFFLRIFPAAEHFIDREQGNRLERRRIFFKHFIRARPEKMLRS